MATIKQKKAVKNLVGNGGNVTRAMLDAEYSPATANTPQKLTESKGYKEVLQEYGLTEELVTTALVEDIKAKPKKRFLELSLGAEILGMKKRETNEGNKTLVVMISGESADRFKIDVQSP